MLALSHGRAWQWAKSRRLLEKALSTNPNDTTARMWYGSLLSITGRVQGALEQLDIAVAQDPVYPTLIRIRAFVLYSLGREKEAKETAKLAIALGQPGAHFVLGRIARNNGDIDQAIEHSITYFEAHHISTKKLTARRQLYEQLYSPKVDRAEFVREVKQQVTTGLLPKFRAAFFYRDVGEVERAMKLYAARVTGSRSFLAHIWRPEHKAMRQHPYFQTFVTRIGLMDYWKAFGFPDLCRPKGDAGIECD